MTLKHLNSGHNISENRAMAGVGDQQPQYKGALSDLLETLTSRSSLALANRLRFDLQGNETHGLEFTPPRAAKTTLFPGDTPTPSCDAHDTSQTMLQTENHVLLMRAKQTAVDARRLLGGTATLIHSSLLNNPST